MQKYSLWKPRLFFLLFLLCAILLLMNVFSSSVRSTFFGVTIPFQSFLWGQGDGMKYKTEADYLQQDIEALQWKLAEFETLQRENEALRNALGLELQKEFRLLGVNVVGKEISRDVIFIDKGSSDGVKEGMPVITPSKVAVGEVIQAYDTSSRVRLLSDQDSSFEASVLPKDTVGVLKGSGRFRANLDLILRDADIQVSDVLFTSHLSSVFPPNLPVGIVQDIDKNDTDTFQKAEVELFFNIYRDALLFVIL